jgi:lipopolysaccharide transport system ATP-binding protein
VRLAFAVAAHLEPEILLVDEVLAVGDIMFQRKCLGKMEDVARAGRTVLFVSHNMGAMRSLCSTGILLDEGRVAYSGDIAKCIESYFTQVGAFQIAGRGPQDAESTSPGFGAVVIQGGEGNSISQEQPIEAETFLRVGPQTAGFSLFCILEDMQSRMAFHLREESPDLGLTEVSEGVYSVRVRVPPLWLSAGLYSLYFKAIIWGNAGDARYLSDKIPLDVIGLHSRAEALLHPAVEWSVSAATARESAAEIFVPIETGKP